MEEIKINVQSNGEELNKMCDEIVEVINNHKENVNCFEVLGVLRIVQEDVSRSWNEVEE